MRRKEFRGSAKDFFKGIPLLSHIIVDTEFDGSGSYNQKASKRGTRLKVGLVSQNLKSYFQDD